jgi:serine/threonine protein kinase
MLTASLPFDDHIMSRLFTKIREARYFMPPFLSGPAQDLIRQMMQANPLARITIPEIKKHEWFYTKLPFYLHIMDNARTEKAMKIDPEAFNAMAKVLTHLT